MKKFKNKKVLIILTIILALIIGVTTAKAQSGLYLSWILNDIRNNLDTYLNRDYSYYYNKKVYVDVDEAVWEKDLTCFGHWYGSSKEDDKVISAVIDLNIDKSNSIKVNGKEYTGNDEYLFQALAKATSEGYNYENYFNTAQDAATGKIIWQLINNGHIGGFDGVNESYGSEFPWENYYNECIAHGRDVVTHKNDGKASSDGYNNELISSELVGKTVYLGPFQYSYTGKGNAAFYNIEITGDNNFSDNISDLNGRLFVKTNNGFTSVNNGNIKPNTDFYISTNSNSENSNKIKVKINLKGVPCYKGRVLLLRAKNGQGGQSLAAYSTGAGKQEESKQSLEYEFENNRGNIEIHKSGRRNGVLINKVENVGFKVFYIENNKNIYLKIQNEEAVGTTENANEASVIYTDKNGDAYVRRVNSRYKYYLEEITDKTEYSSNILKATQKFDEKGAKERDVPIVAKGTAGAIDVKRQKESKQTTVSIEDAIKTGKIKLTKLDFDKPNDIQIFGAKFKVQNKETKQWVKAEGKDGSYKLKTYEECFKNDKDYYKENYTSNESEATEFETNKNGQITIDGVDIGKYELKEVYLYNDNGNINYGYTEIDNPSNIDKNYVFWSTDGGKTKNSLAEKNITLDVVASDKASENSIIVYNKKKYLKIRGYVWEDMQGGKDSSYAAKGEDTYAEGDILVEGINVRLKDTNGNVVKTTKTDKNGAYEFNEVSRESLEDGLYYVEFEYNGLTYTSVVALVGNDSSINSKAGEVVEQRKKLNSAFTEITNKDDINDRSHGYSRDGSGKATGTLTYRNDTENWYSTFESTTYNNETYENVNLTANTNVPGYSLEKEFKAGRYIVDANNAFVIENVNLGMRRREQPLMAISNDIENVQIDVNGYSHTYYYAQRNGNVEDQSAFNVGVKFGNEYISGYTRAIYPSDVKYNAEEANADDARKLKVYVTYVTTIRNMSNNLSMSVNELANYYDKEYERVDSWVGDNNNKVSWTDTSKYGQKYDDGNYKGIYTTALAGTKVNAGENLKVYVTFKVSDKAVLSLLSEEPTLNNTSEIFSYSTYYRSNAEGCNTGDTYAGIDKASAPGNAKPGDKATYEADTDDAPSLLLEAKGVRELAGTVFEDATAPELKSGEERKGSGIYEDGENTVGGVKVDLLSVSDLSKPATVYPPEDTDKPADVKNTKTAQEGKPATMVTGADGKYIFRGIEPDTYLIRYTYTNGTTKLFDKEGKEVKDVTVQDYKSTIITSNEIKQAFEDNDKHLDWYKTTENAGRYSDARDDYNERDAIDKELETLDGTSTPTITSLNANSPKFDIGVEKESVYTSSTGDRYTALTENLDFGIAERPRQSATLDKEVAYLKVTLPNGQVLIDGDPRQGKLDYITVTKDANGKVQEIYITIDNELIYGSQVEIKYDLTLANTSELDYRNQSYYYYGEGKDNPVKFTSATLIDYVDSDIILKAGQEGTWKVLDLADKGYNWNLTPEQEQQILKNYSTLVKAEPLSLEDSIAAGESKTTAIYVEKLLANAEELTYENNGEVVKIGKTGGRTMTTQLGNYATALVANPGAEPGNGETDEAKAEAVTIIPPTGSTDNTVTYAIIGIVSLAVLGAGTYGVRKLFKK